MGRVSRARIIIILLLLGVTALVLGGRPEEGVQKRAVPLAVALPSVEGWRPVRDIPLSAQVTEALLLDDYLFRTFSNGTEQVTLYVGYYYSAGKIGAAHDPMVCMPGQGWFVSDQTKGEIPVGEGTDNIHYSAMIAGLEGNRELFVYWFQASDQATSDTFRQKVVLWSKKLLNQGEENAFVRVNVPLGDRTLEEGLQVARLFIQEFYPGFLTYITEAPASANASLGGFGLDFDILAELPPLYWEMTLFLSLLGLLYVYLGYPALAYLLSLLRPRPVRKGEVEPQVTIVIAAHNEADAIGSTIENKLSLDYPKEKLEILVVSDGSEDATDEIVRGFAERGVRLIRQEPRAGKTSALNLAVPQSAGEIIVFSDANSLYAPDALKSLVSNFCDPKVGYVTGKMVYVNPDGSGNGDGCTTYMKYENTLRSIETRLGSVVGVDGGVDAVRKELYTPMSPDQLPDFILPLRVVQQGFRVVYEPEAVLQEPVLNESSDEYRMRVRVSLRALWALSDMRGLLFSMKNPLFAWQLWSHKVLRYLCFLFLVGSFAGNLALVQEGAMYLALLGLQVGAYVSAFVSTLLEGRGYRVRVLAIPHYFALLNIASAHAFWKFLRRQKQVLWTPRKG